MADESITINQDQEEPYDYDGIWKEFILYFWRDILYDFIPDLYNAADLSREAESLDKELHEITADDSKDDGGKSSKRYVDCLLKIYLKDGTEEWVLLHIEIQGRGGEMISLRMFRYHCLIFLRHKRHPAAIAILTAKRPKKEGEPGIYQADIFGTKIEYQYHTVKAYKYDDEELLASESPVKLFIYAVKVAAKYRKSNEQKFEYMRKILRVLIGKGWDSKRRRYFIIMLEQTMRLSGKEYRIRFRDEVDTLLEGKKMRYKTVIEEMFEEEIEKKRMKISRSLIGLGLLTDEQIAGVTEQTPEDIAELRHELQKAEH
ncbi:MAG: hypothetical protein II869_00670 [Synergistaceae bacterium]|nr:hypothetical protein [Synergistaceae bacterium]